MLYSAENGLLYKKQLKENKKKEAEKCVLNCEKNRSNVIPGGN